VEARQQELIEERSTTASSLVSWGPVFAGTVIGLAMSAMAASLWFALAFERGTATFRNHLDWWVAGTAIGGTLLGAFIAGLASARRGVVSGLLQGLTLWGLLTVALLIFGLSAAALFGTTFVVNVRGTSYTITTTSYWSVFWTMLIGFGAAALGGMLGGSIPRRERSERTAARPAPAYFPTDNDTVSMPPPPVVAEDEPVMSQPAPVTDDVVTTPRRTRGTT